MPRICTCDDDVPAHQFEVQEGPRAYQTAEHFLNRVCVDGVKRENCVGRSTEVLGSLFSLLWRQKQKPSTAHRARGPPRSVKLGRSVKLLVWSIGRPAPLFLCVLLQHSSSSPSVSALQTRQMDQSTTFSLGCSVLSGPLNSQYPLTPQLRVRWHRFNSPPQLPPPVLAPVYLASTCEVRILSLRRPV
jgi:hypothetical protein